MGKLTGFLDYERLNNTEIEPAERVKNFKEFHKQLSDEKRKEQAGRCMDCGVPFCQSAMKLNGMVTGCPLHNVIPEWNDMIWLDNPSHAFSRLNKTSNFPEFTGRVCPALCEKACINGQYDDPVTIHENELYLIETAFEKGYLKPRIPKVRSDKSIAVIGSGPAGLAVADELNHRGHNVEVFERDDRIGGLLMYGIPNMKLDKSIVERRRKLMEAEGVVFHTGVNVGADNAEHDGKSISAKSLLDKFDAVVLACGAKKERGLPAADPAKIKGVYNAVDFLSSTTKSLLSAGMKDGEWINESSDETDPRSVESLMKSKDFISAKGKNVVIVGAGDTATDCIGTSLRHGCKSVTAVMRHARITERLENNPWPEWPKTTRTEYSHYEAQAVFGKDPRVFQTTVKECICDSKGNLKKIVTVNIEFDENHKAVEVPGSEKTLPCDLLLIAAGFAGCENYVPDAFGVKLTKRGTVETAEDDYKTNVDKVFTAGDMRRGQSLVVWAVAEGRKCAKEVDEFLMGYTNLRES